MVVSRFRSAIAMPQQQPLVLAAAILLVVVGLHVQPVRAPSPFHKNHGLPPPAASFGGGGGVVYVQPPTPLVPISVRPAQPPRSYRGPNPLLHGAAAFPAPSLRDQPAANPMRTVFEWRTMDFAYPTAADRQAALRSGAFVPANNLPLGVDRWQDRVFVTLPRWKNGVPASLAWLPLSEDAEAPVGSPAVRPYPRWEAHGDPLRPDCALLMSVYRLWVDECERLWVLDAGVVNATIGINQVCPPKIVAFDLRTDRQLFAYELPADQVRQDSLHSNIVVDVRVHQPDACQQAHAYVTDVWRYGVVVFSLAAFRSWRTTNHLYLPTPQHSDYTLHGLNFQWTDGVFGLSLGDVQVVANGQQQHTAGDRAIFFHPMSSYAEFVVSAAVLQNETLWTVDGGQGAAGAFRQIGERGADGQSSTSGIDRQGVQFFNLIHQDAVGCWDATRPYGWPALGVVARDNRTLVFPNDMKVDREPEQSLWVLSNRLPIYLYAQLDYTQVNFRIQRVDTRLAVRGTPCDRHHAAEALSGPYAGTLQQLY